MKLSTPDVLFDIDADGRLDTVSWPEEPERLAFLALDRNGDGTINDATELLGDHTLPDVGDGFTALLHLVRAEENGRQVAEVNSTDPLFSRLLLWTDINRDGISQPTELQPAANVLKAIGVGVTITGRKDNIGNAYRYKGWARYLNDVERPVYDVILATVRP